MARPNAASAASSGGLGAGLNSCPTAIRKGFEFGAARAAERLNPCLTVERSGCEVMAVRQTAILAFQ